MTCFRRSYLRIKTDFPAKVCNETEVRDDLMVKNISARGACIISRKVLAVDQKIEIHMHVPFLSSPVVKKAKVIWSKMLNESLCQAGIDFGLDNMMDLPGRLF